MKKRILMALFVIFFLFASTLGYAEGSSSEVIEDIPLGWPISSDHSATHDQQIEDDDIDTMWDGEITFYQVKYDTRDILVFGQNDKFTRVATSLTSTEDDYHTDVVLETNVDAIKYYYAFDETIQPSQATSANPLEIRFLGKTLKITSIDWLDDDKFTAQVGTEYFMYVGDAVEVEDKTVILENVGETSTIIVDVDGVKETIGSTAETVNGIEIMVLDTFYETTKAQRSANLLMGTQAIVTYQDGDAYIGEDPDDPDWRWNIGNLNDEAATTTSTTTEYTGPYLGIENDFVWNDDSDDPAGIGECIDLPNNYLRICLDSLTVADDDYLDYTIEYDDDFDLSDVDPGMVSEQVIIMTTDISGFGFHVTLPPYEVASAAKVVVLRANLEEDLVEIYEDQLDDTLYKRGEISLSEDPFYFASPINNVDDLEFKMYIEEGSVFLDLVTETSLADENIRIVLGDDGVNFNGLGETSEVAEAYELRWYDELVWENEVYIGKKDEDHRSSYGTIIQNPKSNSQYDKVVLEIPLEQVFAKVAIRAGVQEAQEEPPEPTDEIEYAIALEDGWNLISIPLILKYNSVDIVMADIAGNIEVIYGYNPLATGKWEVWRPNPETANSLSTIEPGKAYWIKMDKAATLNVHGTIDIKNGDAPGTIPTFNVYEGWNLIGYHGTQDETASTALQNIDGEYSAIWTLFQDNIQSLQGTLKGVSFWKQLKRTHGYWIFLKEDGVIVPTS